MSPTRRGVEPGPARENASSLGIATATFSPKRSGLAMRSASRASVFTRSPTGRERRRRPALGNLESSGTPRPSLGASLAQPRQRRLERGDLLALGLVPFVEPLDGGQGDALRVDGVAASTFGRDVTVAAALECARYGGTPM